MSETPVGLGVLIIMFLCVWLLAAYWGGSNLPDDRNLPDTTDRGE